ncbi:MAG: hypothetical protein KY391_04530 [Actinobacteria bacterium]|nr:hypothetical protein [Actinomycetota bacterium]
MDASSLGASWSGFARNLFDERCTRLALDARTGSDAMDQAAAALNELAAALESAQEMARQAQAYANQANSIEASARSQAQESPLTTLFDEASMCRGRAISLENQATALAQSAAARAAGVFNAVASMAPSVKTPAWAAVRGLSRKQLSAYLSLDLDDLSSDVQYWVGRRLADYVQNAVEEDIDHDDLAALFATLESNGHDGDFAAGFFNAFGGTGTLALVGRLNDGFTAFSDDLQPFMQPLSVALGAATRSGRLESTFVDELMPFENGAPTNYSEVAQLVQYGRFDHDFAVKAGEVAVLLATQRASAHSIVPGQPHLDMKGIILDAVARTPEAANTLARMSFDEAPPSASAVGEAKSYLTILLRSQYNDGAGGLANFLEAATFGVRSSDPGAANDVVYRLIREAPRSSHEYGLFARPTQVLAEIGAAWWEDLATSAYGEHRDIAVALGATASKVRVSADDAAAFVELIVGAEGDRALIRDAAFAYANEELGHAASLTDMDARWRAVGRAGASLELFSVGDSVARREYGQVADEVSAFNGSVATAILTKPIGAIPLLADPLSFAASQWLGEQFETNEQVIQMSETERQDLFLRTQLDVAVVNAFHEAGHLTDAEVKRVLRYMWNSSGTHNARFEDVFQLSGQGARVMNELRSNLLKPEK